MYRYWAIGWVIYTAAAIWGVLLSTSELVITDIFSLSGLYVGATLIVDGTKGKKLTQKRISVYLLGIILFTSLLMIGLVLSWPFYFVFAPLGLHIVYVCALSAKTVYEISEPIGQPRIWLLSGLITWGFSWSSFPIIGILPEYYSGFMVIQAIGVIITGASMMTLFIRTLTQDLERQYKVTQIMSSLVQHDIRNYIQVAKLSLELTEDSNLVNNHWIEVASQSLDGARDFVDEMREVASTLTRSKPEPEPTQLRNLVESIRQRVIAEYNIPPDQVDIQVSDDTFVMACRLSSELLWNIVDNAFKHGSESILVKEMVIGNPQVALEILDRGGGLPSDIKSFLNGSDSLSEEIAPGMGLGIILIQSIAEICKSNIHVEDIEEDSKVIGTKFTVHFELAKQAT
jgi:signal transduction histidine kinase